MDKDEIERMFPDIIDVARRLRDELGDGVKIRFIECHCGFIVGKKDDAIDQGDVVSLADMVRWGTFVPDDSSKRGVVVSGNVRYRSYERGDHE